MRKESFEFLTNYLKNPSPSGDEVLGQLVWQDYMREYVDEFRTDAYGNMIGVINPEAEYKVVIEAHADEIGWNVNYISDEGFIYVNRNGGSDAACAPGKRVNIHATDGTIVPGVFGQTAIHMRERGDEKVPKVEELFIDVGAANKTAVEYANIEVGCKITYPDGPLVMGGDRLVGRALDNKVGGFMIAEVARMLMENKDKLDFGLYIVNAVQEEVGLRGAEMAVASIKPNVAIVTDVCHDTNTPGINKMKFGDTKIGGGPVVAYAPSIQNNLRQLILDAAENQDIEVQKIVSSYSSGTDTDAFAYANGGTPTALIKIPLRYMHTAVETASMDDIQNAIDLIYHSVLAIEPGDNFSYFN